MVVTRSQKPSQQGPTVKTPSGPSTTLDSIATTLRAIPTTTHAPVSEKPAAVLVPLFEDEEGNVSVVLTRRSPKLSTHSGEVCLPGGKRDESDVDDVACALREAEEELGLSRDAVQVLCTLPPLLSKHKLSVSPVVARIPPGCSFTPNPDEVDRVFHMPLEYFLQKHKRHQHKEVQWQEFCYRLHYFDYQEFCVWGLTAAIMIEVAQLALQRPAEFAVHTPGHPPYTAIGFNGKQLVHRL